MDSPSPRVTVLMSVYNGQRYLREAIDSILNQTFRDFEFLIINDGSTDGSRNIILSYDDHRIRLVDNPVNIGLTKSLNRGLALSRGTLIARQDADDVSHANRLENQVEFMDTHPNFVLLGTQARYIDAKGRLIRNRMLSRAITKFGMQWQLMCSSSFIHTSVMFRKEVVWDRFHGYDENFVKRQDFELWSRIAFIYPVANLPHALVDFRVHSASASANYVREDTKAFEKVALNNMRSYLKDPNIPEEWAHSIAWMHATAALDPIENPAKLVKVIRSIWTRFVDVNPGAESERDLRRQFASDLCRGALCLASRDRWASIRAYALAWCKDLKIAKSCVLKYLVLVLFGESLSRLFKAGCNAFSKKALGGSR